MSVSNTPFTIPPASQKGIIEFYKQCTSLQSSSCNLRGQFRTIDLAYMREQDYTDEHQSAKAANKYGDPRRFQNIKVPVVKPLVEAAVTYQTSVFLTGVPIFGVVSTPDFEDEALQLETVIETQSIRGRWVQELMKFFRDGFKYNLSAVEIPWKREVVASLSYDATFSTKQAKPTEVIWEGNAIKRLDLYNTFFDTRVFPSEIPEKGEFVGYTERYSRIALKAFIAALPYKIIQNIVPAFESGIETAGVSASDDYYSYYTPPLNPDTFQSYQATQGFNWLAWAGQDTSSRQINYKNSYDVTTLYARILPADFNLRLPSASTPQIWKFIIVNHSVIIYAERQTNAHGLIPILFGQPYEDGLGLQTKSLASDVSPMQDISSALANSWIASRRRAISDRVLYDPSRIASEHINSPNPSAKIPVRPAAYGKNLAESVYAFPFRDDQAGIAMQEMQQIQQFSFALTGQNQVKQGQFVKGNKTLHEYADVMSHSNGNDQKVALQYENQVFIPLKTILKTNIIQYQGGTSLLSPSRKQVVKIDPIALSKAVLDFQISDGLTPTDKIIGGEEFQTALQVLGSSPQLGAGYNLSPLFSYLMKTRGADLKPFEKSPQQIAYEQAAQQWQQVVMEAIKQGVDATKLPPQPTPQQYGYNPQTMNASVPQAAPEVATRVNNITNNIQNTGEQ